MDSTSNERKGYNEVNEGRASLILVREDKGRESFLGSLFGLRIATVAPTVKKKTPDPLSVPDEPLRSGLRTLARSQFRLTRPEA